MRQNEPATANNLEWSTPTMQHPVTPGHHQGTHRRLVRGTAALALIASGLVGACSGGNSGNATTQDDQPKPSSSATGSAKDSGKDSGKNSASAEAVGARSDLQGFTCDAASTGVWSASGKVVNSTKKSAKYTVDVAVASVKTSTVVGSATKTLTVDSGKTVSFTVPTVATRKGDGFACTPHVTRAAG